MYDPVRTTFSDCHDTTDLCLFDPSSDVVDSTLHRQTTRGHRPIVRAQLGAGIAPPIP